MKWHVCCLNCEIICWSKPISNRWTRNAADSTKSTGSFKAVVIATRYNTIALLAGCSDSLAAVCISFCTYHLPGFYHVADILVLAYWQ